MKRTFSTLVCFIITAILCVSSNAKVFTEKQTLSTADLASFAETCLNVSSSVDADGSVVLTTKNIDTFVKRASDVYRVSDADIAKCIYREVGTSDNIIDSMPEDVLLAALNYKSCVKTTSYIKINENNEKVQMSENEMVLELSGLDSLTEDGRLLIESNRATITPSKTVTTSSDGYMRIITVAFDMGHRQGDVSGRQYYDMSATATWLKMPFFRFEDVLAITSSLILDNNDSMYAYISATAVERTEKGDFVYTHRYGKNANKNSPADGISIEFSAGLCGAAARFDLPAFHLTNGRNVLTQEEMEAYISIRGSLYNCDGSVQAAYAHKEVGAGSISVSFAPKSIGFSLPLEFSLSKYYGEPVSLYWRN